MRIVSVTSLVATFSTALITGFFYAWVCSTMWGLDAISPKTAIEAMNGMNISVRNGVFFPAFFLTPVLLVVAAVVNWWHAFRKPAILFLSAACIYFLFAFLPTAMVNVPMNKELELIVDPALIENAAEVWQTYSNRWQIWNIARTIASGVSLILALIALLKIAPVSVAQASN